MNPTTARLKFLEARYHLLEARIKHDDLQEDLYARLCAHYDQLIGKAKGESVYVE